MNKFSIYQYALILLVLVLGSIYALPNLYPTQPSIQVAYTDSAKSADQILLNDLEEILEKSENLPFALVRTGALLVKILLMEPLLRLVALPLVLLLLMLLLSFALVALQCC